MVIKAVAAKEDFTSVRLYARRNDGNCDYTFLPIFLELARKKWPKEKKEIKHLLQVQKTRRRSKLAQNFTRIATNLAIATYRYILARRRRSLRNMQKQQQQQHSIAASNYFNFS